VLATGGGAVLLPKSCATGAERWLRGVPEDLGGLNRHERVRAGARPAAAEQCDPACSSKRSWGDSGLSLCAAARMLRVVTDNRRFATSQKTSCGNSTLSRRSLGCQCEYARKSN